MEDSGLGDYYHLPTFRPVVATRSDTADCSKFDSCPRLADGLLYSTLGVVEPELVAIDPSMEPVGNTSIDIFGLTQPHQSSVLSGIIRADWYDGPTGVGSMEGCGGSFGFTGDQYRHIDEEETVSTILSNCESLWNLSNASSGESENNHIITTITPYNNSPNPNEAISLASKRSKGEGAIHISFTNPAKRPRPGKKAAPRSSNIDFRREKTAEEADPEAIAHVKEMIYRAAAFRPVPLAGEEEVEKPRRKNVRISSDPQTVAARHRRERISERLRVLQRLVPGGSKLDTASMLDEAANYLKFLKSQVIALENGSNNSNGNNRLDLKSINVVGNSGGTGVNITCTPFSTFFIPPLFSHAAQNPNDCSNPTSHDDIIM